MLGTYRLQTRLPPRRRQNDLRLLKVTFTVKNDGAVTGAEVPQVYLRLNDKDEPSHRLVGWSEVSVKPGEVEEVTVVF